MASGRLGALKPSAGLFKTLYKPSGAVAVCSVSICNQSTSDDTFYLAVAQSASSDVTAAVTEYVAFKSLIKGTGDSGFADRAMFGPYELNSSGNDQLIVASTNGTTSFVVTGDEGAV